MNEDFYIELIYKNLQNQLSDKEKAQLNSWLASNEEHQQMADEISQVYTLSEGYGNEEIENIDVESAWKEQLTLIEQEPSEAKVVQLNPNKQRGRIIRLASAAIILLCVGIGMRYLIQESSNESLEIVASADKQLVELPDGSKAYLKKNATIIYPASFSRKERNVSLEGEAVFEVVKNKGDFIVKSSIGAVKVLGTTFKVNTSKEKLQVAVFEGKVNVSMYDVEKSINLLANEQAIGSVKDKEIIKYEGVDNTSAWYNHILKFEDVALREACKELSNYYQKEIRIDNVEMIDCPLTATFQNQDLTKVLTTLDAIYSTESQEVNDSTILIKNGICN